MRVAFICYHTCPLARLGERSSGGMNVYVRYLAGALARQGWGVDIFTRRHSQEEPPVVSLGEGVRVVHLPGGPEGEGKERLHLYLEQFASALLGYAEAHRLRYDLVHSHYWLSGLVGLELAREWGVPHIACFHTLAEVKRRARVGEREPHRRIAGERRVVAGADRVVAFTPHERDALVRYYGADPDRVAVVPCGVDTSLFRPLNPLHARKALGLDGQGVLLFVGRLEPLKGVELLLQAVALLDGREGVRVLIVGGGPHPGVAVNGLRDLACSLGIAPRVEFVGSVPHASLPLYYSAADALVLPSYYESFGLVALEAMACGTPVVAARVGGLRSIVRDGETGYLVPWHCPEPYAQRLEVLLRNEHLRRSMGERARRLALGMDWARVAQAMVSLYREAVRGRSGSPCGGLVC